MAYDALKPADDQFISAGPGDIRENMRALKDDKIVNAQKVMDYSPGNGSGNIPVSNGTVNTNLNADTLDGNHASAFATAGHTHSAATTSSNGFMASTDKTKLDGIAAGAEVNQNAFAAVVVGATTIQADAESDTLTFTAGANITLTPDATNDAITIAVSGTVPTATSAGTCTGNAATATTASACSGNAATATKLATVRTINGVSFDGSANITIADSTKAPTSHASTATTYGVSTASNYGHAKATSAAPLVAGTAAVGTDNGLFARGDHVHPVQTSVSGNAGTATKLATARTISLTGDVNGSASFDGATDVSIAATIVSGAGALGIADYVNTGLKFGTPSGLSLPVAAGTANIGGSNVSFGGGSLTLTARKASMPYLTSAGALGKVEAAYPTAYIDNNTVGFWIFNQAVGAAVPNSAVGISSIAVANNLTPTGTFTRVDGRCDYAIKGDGTSAGFVSANYTNFPSGTNNAEIVALYTHATTKNSYGLIAGYGVVSGQKILLYTASNNNVYFGNGGTVIDTGFTMVVGQTYIVNLQFGNNAVSVYINGYCIVNSYPFSVSIAANVLYVTNTSGFSEYSTGVIHFVELRNKCRSSQQIAEIAAKLLFPVCWDKVEATYPTISAADKATAWHEWKCDETSGTTVADSAGTLNGTATGTTIVDSELGLGKARKYASASDYITLGSYTIPNAVTIIRVVDIPNYSNNYPLLSNRVNSAGLCMKVVASGSTGGKKLNLSPYGADIYGSADVPTGKPVFLAAVLQGGGSGGQCTFYVDSPLPDAIVTMPAFTNTAQTLFINKDVAGTSGGTFVDEYTLILPRALTQAEIAEIYDALMTKSRKSLKSILPDSSISLGYAYAGTSSVIEVNDSDWGYGRREKAYGGNRVKFLGFAPYSGATMLFWNNPFVTSRTRIYYTWAADYTGTVETPFSTFSSTSGIIPQKGLDPSKIIARIITNGISFDGSTWVNTGYVGCYAEVLEDESV